MKKTGFTLIELLVVFAIIGILVAMLLPALQAAKRKHDQLVGTGQAEQAPTRFQLITPMSRLEGAKEPNLYIGVVKDSKTGIEYILMENLYHSTSLTPLLELKNLHPEMSAEAK